MKSDYARWVKIATVCATASASILLLIKVIAWWITGSISLLAALLDSMVDIVASLTNLIVVRYALLPPDDDHSFGHGKAESLAALAQSMFISGSAIFLLLMGFQKLLNPEQINTPMVGVVVIAISLVLTICLVMFQYWVIKRTQSQAIKADMLHYQSDIFMNLAVLAALFLSWYGIVWADGFFAILIGVYILYSAWHIAYEAIQSLLDRALPDAEQQLIMETIRNWPGILGAHDLRTRQSGPTRFIQVHLELDDNLPLVEAHDIAEQIESKLYSLFPYAEIIIHQDPSIVVPIVQKGFWQN